MTIIKTLFLLCFLLCIDFSSSACILPNLCFYDNNYQLVRTLPKGELWEFEAQGEAQRLTVTNCGVLDLRYGYTLLEFTRKDTITYYDISLVDGFSTPLSVFCSSQPDDVFFSNLCFDQCSFYQEENTCSSPCKINPNVEDCCLPPKYQGSCPSNDWKITYLNSTKGVYLQPFDDSFSLHTCEANLVVFF
nr:p21 [Olive leaf yellowing-associated virus]